MVQHLVDTIESLRDPVYDLCGNSSGIFLQSVEFIHAYALGKGNDRKGATDTSISGHQSSYKKQGLARTVRAIRSLRGILSQIADYQIPRKPLRSTSMPKISRSATRHIIQDFAAEIRKRRTETAKPETAVIPFRNEVVEKVERKVWHVPIDLLRFRKDNGRIASDILDYERSIGPLDESEEEHQNILRNFLQHKDPEKTEVLRKSVLHSGQREPAIVTCDGFLINGNRRKMVLDLLRPEFPVDQRFAHMKVVILPNDSDPGGPPTLLEIEQLENRYQLQSDGKSEYYGFDRALSIQRKIELGFPLDDQLRDDPQYAGLSKSDLKREIRKAEQNYLQPLECVERYLRQFGREGQYGTVSSGISDKEGRWQSFIDYSNTLRRDFLNRQRRRELGIQEEEIGIIEEAAFDIIRLRSLPSLPKAHVIMRDLGKYCRTSEGRKEIKAIATEVQPQLPAKDCVDENGQPLTRQALDAKWAARYKQPITYRVKKAVNSHERQTEKETPLTLLEASYKKLVHPQMDLASIAIGDFSKARELAAKIKRKADTLESEIYHQEKNLRKLTSR